MAPTPAKVIPEEHSNSSTSNKIRFQIINPNRVPVKSIVVKPRLILKEKHLMSRKGLAALPDVLSNAKFKGSGHELDDLRLLLSKSRHWAHRVFPTLRFEDFVEKSEKLGSKKRVRLFANRIVRNEEVRYADDLSDLVKSDNEDGDDDNGEKNQEMEMANEEN
ncbi:hypothetical protein RDWZM_004729 [Blomia tropicalis]|uniref:TIMELESS-interacting protein n=1 Tax=Blomia tropicalis TaxID=40697 RepID=A0A9Q0M4M1_BLOTA|nr:hypothetical protein RDWZM_004729 [Blomia tropicalis]